ncbi:hypothetical protein AaE_012205, partial [Aphanomyces astaci]
IATSAALLLLLAATLTLSDGPTKPTVWKQGTRTVVPPSVVPPSTSTIPPTPTPATAASSTTPTSVPPTTTDVANATTSIPNATNATIGYVPTNQLPAQGVFTYFDPTFGRTSRVRIVESLPLGDFDLAPLPNTIGTAEALALLFDSAVRQLDICAMYWNLLGAADHAAFSPDQMKQFGADRGVAVLAALRRAIKRGVVVRIVGSTTFAPFPELDGLDVELRLWDASYWYGGGIMHQKLVLVDQQHAYLGSANMDWKSMAQVMEVGVVVERSRAIVLDMQRLFNLWWLWSDPAKKSVCLSVMDFVPYSTYKLDSHNEGSIYWPALVDTMLQVVYARPVAIRILVSRWAHTSAVMIKHLKILQTQSRTCPCAGGVCLGNITVRLFEVPGWDDTGDHRKWPAFSRVNHAKYIVTDGRANVGTSNMEWGYFYNTAGTSFNTDNTEVIDSLQKIFDRNWDSPYAIPLYTYR